MINKIDLLYILKYNDRKLIKACKRLKCSIQSLINQPVNIIIVNYSSSNIVQELINITEVEYYNHPTTVEFSRAKSINYAVKHYIKTDYFAVSDIDLVYHPKHFQKLLYFIKTSNENKPVRIVNYNYNVYQRFRMPYTSNRFLLKIIYKKSPGGYAHGNGIIHLDSFMKIHGYDEHLIGYGPEDDLFNCRIGKINNLIFIPDDEHTTYHLWHEINAYNEDQYKNNMELWLSSKVRLWGLSPNNKTELAANSDLNWWGELK